MELGELKVQERVQKDHWWYVGRRQILDDLLRSIVAWRNGRGLEWACDVGSGVGSHLPVLRRYARRVVAADISPFALEHCRRKGYDEVVSSTLEQPPSEEQCARYDLVTAMDVLEHLDDDRAGASNLFELLAPDGWAVVTVPAFRLLWGLQDDVSHHRRRYRLSELTRLLTDAGLEIERATYCNSLLFPPILAARLAMRLRRPRGVRSENEINSPAINSMLTRVFLAESRLLRRGWRFPLGVSALVLGRRPGPVPAVSPGMNADASRRARLA